VARGETLLFEAPVRGFFLPDGCQPVRNRFNRNMGYAIDGLLRLADVSLYDTGGTARTVRASTGGLCYDASASSYMGVPALMRYGIGTTAPSVADVNLVSPDLLQAAHYIDTVEATTSTQLVLANRWAPDGDKSYMEAGLFYYQIQSNYMFLLARTVFTAALPRSGYTEYFDGYALSFPASCTRWFVRALAATLSGQDRTQARFRPFTATDGLAYVLQAPRAFAGSPDVMIGSDNTSPTPTDTNLKAPIASLASQTQSVEVDTTLQQVRVVRTGTYTPTANVTLGEIGLFAYLNGYRAGALAGRKTLLVRVALETPVTLYANTTYTLGIVLVLA